MSRAHVEIAHHIRRMGHLIDDLDATAPDPEEPYVAHGNGSRSAVESFVAGAAMTFASGKPRRRRQSLG